LRAKNEREREEIWENKAGETKEVKKRERARERETVCGIVRV